MENKKTNTELEKVLHAGRLAKISLYRRLLKNVAEGAPLTAYELRAIRDLGAELEAMAEEKNGPTQSDFAQVSRQELSAHVFRVTPQTISKWVLKEGMPRNENGTFCVADCVEWFMERVEQSRGSGGDELDEAKQWLTEFRKERALKARMERETLEEQLFPREEVTAAWCNRYAHIKRHLLVWSKRLPGRLVGLSEREMISSIEVEVRFLLSMLSRPGRFAELAEDFEKNSTELLSNASGSGE
jgi:hypothetical protein